MQEVDTTADGYRASGFGPEYVAPRARRPTCTVPGSARSQPPVLAAPVRCSFVAFVGKDGGKHVSFALLFPTFSTWKGRCLYLEVCCQSSACAPPPHNAPYAALSVECARGASIGPVCTPDPSAEGPRPAHAESDGGGSAHLRLRAAALAGAGLVRLSLRADLRVCDDLTHHMPRMVYQERQGRVCLPQRRCCGA